MGSLRPTSPPRRLRLAAIGPLTLALLSGCASLAPGAEPREFAGRTVVVTGASSGFGRGVALALGARGADVVVAARRVDLLESVAAEIRRSGGRAVVAPTDVSRPDDVARLTQVAIAAFGHVDVWINDAGVVAIGRFDETPVADSARVVDVNLKGVIYGSWEALRRFRAQGSGVLINMGSVESRLPLPYQSVYVATKHAILGFDDALAQELRLDGARGIRVVTVMPWAADTPVWDHAANYTGRAPRAPMLDDPGKTVRTVLDAIRRPHAFAPAGWKAKAALLSVQLAPGLTQRVSADIYHHVQMQHAPSGAPPTSGSLHAPLPTGGGVDGGLRARWRAEDAAASAPPPT